MFEFCKNQINKFIYKIEDICDSEQYKIAFFGSDLDSCFSSNFEYSKFLDEFSIYNFDEDAVFDMILIAGNINYKQLAIIKEFIDKSSINFIIHIPGTSLKRNNQNLYNVVANLEEEITFNLVFNQYPINLTELTKKIKDIKRGCHEH
jgi:hypothetical protein